MNSPVQQHVTIKFLHRTVLFFFSFLIALFSLFILGNIQNFLNASQLIILRFLIGTGVLLFLFALFAIVFECYYMIHVQSAQYLFHCIISGVACVFGLAIAVVAAVILLLSAGLQPI